MSGRVAALAAAALLAGATPAAGHGGAAGVRDHADPVTAGAVGLVVAAYLVGARRLRARRGRVPPGHRALFLAGCALAIGAALPPLHDAAHRSASGHMVQHLLLIAGAGPLLALSRPSAPLLWSLPGAARRRAAAVPRALGAAVAGGAGVLAAAALHAIVLFVWHLPGPYDAALRDPAFHRLEHLTLLGTALAAWWGLLAAWRNGGGRCVAGIGAASLGLVACGVLGLLMMFARAPWYAGHGDGAGALADQQIAGALMWGPGGLAFLLAAAVLTARLLRGHADPADRPPGLAEPGAEAHRLDARC